MGILNVRLSALLATVALVSSLMAAPQDPTSSGAASAAAQTAKKKAIQVEVS